MQFKAFFFLFTLFFSLISSDTGFLAGTGIYDITGPAAGVGMMGYAMINQRSSGIHLRLRARAFTFVSSNDPNHRVTYVSADLCFGSFVVKSQVLKALDKELPGVFNHANLMLSGTHTHAGPAGFSGHTLYDLTSFGFNNNNFDNIVDGIVNAILMAEKKLTPAKLSVNKDYLKDPLSNVNRSPSAYANNPYEERMKYKYNVDKQIVTLRADSLTGEPLGVVAWFAVHGTSMNNENTFISGDNKGYASYVFEKKVNGESIMAGMGPFVAAFGQSNEGDVSPNTKGAHCPDGTPCGMDHSICNGTSQTCIATGPGKDEFESTKLVGEYQFNKAFELYNDHSKAIVLNNGKVRYVHTFLNMTNITVTPEFSGLNKPVSTCKPALGDSFAAGTTDGPGDFNFEQGTNSSDVNPYWNMISHLIIDNPPKDQIKCHSPKPILLYLGDLKWPTPWVAHTLPIQMFQIGDLYILAVPGEFTTMSGRRLRDTVEKQLKDLNAHNENTTIVIAGLSNTYSQYITTTEEYQVQRYEGASTLYGPQTLNAYRQEFAKLTHYIVKDQQSPPGYTPPDHYKTIKKYDLLPRHLWDQGDFGKVLKDAKPSYKRGDIVRVDFYTGSPNNNLRTQDTFLTVEKQVDGKWIIIATDGDFSTKYRWERHISFPEIAESYAIITWETEDATPGTYRIRHFGNAKPNLFSDHIISFVGTSSTFKLE